MLFCATQWCLPTVSLLGNNATTAGPFFFLEIAKPARHNLIMSAVRSITADLSGSGSVDFVSNRVNQWLNCKQALPVPQTQERHQSFTFSKNWLSTNLPVSFLRFVIWHPLNEHMHCLGNLTILVLCTANWGTLLWRCLWTA